MLKLLLAALLIPAVLGRMDIGPAPQQSAPLPPPPAASSAAAPVAAPAQSFLVVDETVGDVFGVVGDVVLCTRNPSGGHRAELTFYAQNVTSGQTAELMTLAVYAYMGDSVCLQDRYLYFVMPEMNPDPEALLIVDGVIQEQTQRILCFDAAEMTLEAVATYPSSGMSGLLTKVDEHRFLLRTRRDGKTAATDHICLFDTATRALTTVCTSEMFREDSEVYWSQWSDKTGPSPLTGEQLLCADFYEGLVYVLKVNIGSPPAYRLDVYDLSGRLVRTVPIPTPQIEGYAFQNSQSYPSIRSICVNSACMLIKDWNPAAAIVYFDGNGTLLPHPTFSGVFSPSVYADFGAPLVFLSYHGGHGVLNNTARTLRETRLLDSEAYQEGVYTFDGGITVVSWIYRDGVAGVRRRQDIQRVRFFDSPQALDAALITADSMPD